MIQIQEDLIEEMKVQTASLIEIVKGASNKEEWPKRIASISDIVYKFKETFTLEDVLICDLDYFAWRRVENRMRRTKRLIDLGAPNIIVENEAMWLELMIDHMEKIFNEIFPVYTKEQKENIHSLREIEESFND